MASPLFSGVLRPGHWRSKDASFAALGHTNIQATNAVAALGLFGQVEQVNKVDVLVLSPNVDHLSNGNPLAWAFFAIVSIFLQEFFEPEHGAFFGARPHSPEIFQCRPI